MGPCLGLYGGPRGGGDFYEQGNPVDARPGAYESESRPLPKSGLHGSNSHPECLDGCISLNRGELPLVLPLNTQRNYERVSGIQKELHQDFLNHLV